MNKRNSVVDRPSSFVSPMLVSLAFACGVSLAACGGGQPAPTSTPAPATTETPLGDAGAESQGDGGATGNATAAAEPEKPKTFALVVSFVNKGKGVDTKTRDKISETINKWRISKGVDLKTTRPKYGKDEMDICGDFGELADADRTKLFGELKKAVDKNDRVVLAENASCHADEKGDGPAADTKKDEPKKDAPKK